MPKTEIQVGIRVTVEFKQRLERQAGREYRTISNLIIKILSEYLDRCELLNRD